MTGIREFRRDVYFFTKEETYILTDGDVVNYVPRRVSRKGCTAHQTIVDIGDGLVWQGADDIYWANFNTAGLDGDLAIPAGTWIRDAIRTMGITKRANSRAVLHDDRYFLTYTRFNGTANTSTLVLDTRTKGWTTVDWAATDIQENNGVMYTCEGDNFYIHQHDTDEFVDRKTYSTESAIPFTWQSKRLLEGHELAKKIIKSISIMAVSSGITAVVVVECNNGSFSKQKTLTIGSATDVVGANAGLWGIALWDDVGGTYTGTNLWADGTPQHSVDNTRVGIGAKCADYTITVSSLDGKDTNIIGVKTYYRRTSFSA